MDKKIINPLYGIKAGVGQAIHRDDIKQSDIIRQDAIQPEEKVEVPWLFNVHMEKVLTRMNPGICTSAAGDHNRKFKDPADTVFQHFLHTQLIGLPLPAKILCSLIGNMYEISQSIQEYSAKLCKSNVPKQITTKGLFKLYVFLYYTNSIMPQWQNLWKLIERNYENYRDNWRNNPCRCYCDRGDDG